MKKRFTILNKILIGLLCFGLSAYTNNYCYSSEQIYDSWEIDVTSMPVAVDYFSSAVHGNNIYYIGGYVRNDNKASGLVQIYNTITNTWSYGAEMITPRYFAKAIQYNNKIYCFGGVSEGSSNLESDVLNIVEIYDIATNTWSRGINMPETKEKMDIQLYNDKILVIGGVNERGHGTHSTNINVFNLKTNSWEENIPMNICRAGFTSQIYDDKLYIFSGNYSLVGQFSTDYNDVNIYDFKTKTWSTGPNSSVERHGVSSIRNGHDIYLFGGRGNYQNRKEVDIYNIKTNSWRKGTSSPIELHWSQAIMVNGYVYCVLGEKANGSISKYTPERTPHTSSNIDVYIKPQNILSLSLNTNIVTFEDFDSVNDMEIPNSMQLSISSSLPYQVKTSLATDIANKDKTNTITPEILSIKTNNMHNYETFNKVGQPILLLDDQPPTDCTQFGIDFRLNKGIPFKVDTYKTVVKFEVNQK